jgi:hypothetical protein
MRSVAHILIATYRLLEGQSQRQYIDEHGLQELWMAKNILIFSDGTGQAGGLLCGHHHCVAAMSPLAIGAAPVSRLKLARREGCPQLNILPVRWVGTQGVGFARRPWQQRPSRQR